eukprot:CAMPEP_0170278844 /NCGR_PEP_ID=MMETSP0116_2-20130129/39430_1 /TAXON_ID=400756 /ORGANISM="Durinskia baltica, Strain CSIRO CS-38" /LENGTH=623 /DNA_ID=CAMNT_0010530163 /DNA_START=29 /DNA_END=1898 /DNA_ORIENTATION=+
MSRLQNGNGAAVRSRCFAIREACRKLPGAHVLDVNLGNVNDYCCGAFALVERDLEAVLPPRFAYPQLPSVAGVREAFRVREELVNYKKVALHMHHQGNLLERRLAQLATFFRSSEWNEQQAFYVHTPERAVLSAALTQCRGRCEASYDARVLGKFLCGLGRHPESSLPIGLVELPNSLRCFGAARAASLAMSIDGGSKAPVPNIPKFVRLSCICRGVDKALRIRDELWRAREALRVAIAQAEATLKELSAQPSPEQVAEEILAAAEHGDTGSQNVNARSVGKGTCDVDEGVGGAPPVTPLMERMAASVRIRRHFNMLTGCLPFLRESLRWFDAIEACADNGDSRRLFVAGDARISPDAMPPAICVPTGFEGGKAQDDLWRRLSQHHGVEMRRRLAVDGWPSHVIERRGLIASSGGGAPLDKNKACRLCCRQFSALWVHRGICCECEDAVRDDGRCPFGERCSASWFCPHERKCFVCDAHSCEECRIFRGDGEFVVGLAGRLGANAMVALDFDRTLASTRSGARPVMGQHDVDVDLLSLLCLRPASCTIITRNSHTDAIRTFLLAHGAPEGLTVQTVKRPTSKAERLLPHLAPEAKAVLVDDSIAELVDPMIASDPRVHRVLFV